MSSGESAKNQRQQSRIVNQIIVGIGSQPIGKSCKGIGQFVQVHAVNDSFRSGAEYRLPRCHDFNLNQHVRHDQTADERQHRGWPGVAEVLIPDRAVSIQIAAVYQ